jgi:drug/metabolite transporter (DMT)-like permease
MLANALYLIAVREGPLTAVVTLSSLYPASTVVLARLVLHERLGRLQVAGIATALVAIMMIVSS